MSINEFKNIARKRVNDIEKQRFKISAMLYKSLALFSKCISDISMWSWWKFLTNHCAFSHQVRMLSRLLFNQSCLKEAVAAYDRSSPICDNCDMRCVESVCHLLFECPYYRYERAVLWGNLLDICPAQLQAELINMNSEERTVFIISGMHDGYIEEWNDIFHEMLNYCHKLYMMRCQ